MALCNLATKMRIAADAAPRLTSAPLVSPALRSRVVPFSSSSCSSSSSNASELASQHARERYLAERERYVDTTRELKYYRIEVLWTERFCKLLSWTYRLVLTCAIGDTCLRATGFRPTHVTVKDSSCRCMCTHCKKSVCDNAD